MTPPASLALQTPPAAPPGPDFTTESWPALGTTVVVRYQGPANPRIRRAVQIEVDAIDVAASRFRPDSELSRLNDARGARLAVSPLFLEALSLAVRAAQISGGAVDPTLGESLIAAGYDRDWSELAAVSVDAPFGVRDRIVVLRRRDSLWQDIELGDQPPSVRLPRGVSLDLGATAKALAADRAAAAAHRAADAGVLVSLGGDIATGGPAPDGGWTIRVTDDHRAGPEAPGQTVAIQSGGLATSSIVTRRWQHQGQAMHHILDPRSGAPVHAHWRTVSVVAATCADANIAATASIVLGRDATGWLAEQGLPARLIALDGTERVQGGWPR
jgi:thiamine biosynthesis lipoprotein